MEMLNAVAIERPRDVTVNSVVSERLRVPELKDDDIIVYKLLAHDVDDLTRVEESSGKRMKQQQAYSFVGRKRIYDPFAKKRVLIQNITSFTPTELPGGQIVDKPVVKRVNFPITGEVTLTSRDFHQICFMERMDENRDNEFRDQNVTPRFYRVNSKRALIKELEDDYIKVDAMVWIKDAQEAEIKRIYIGLDAETKKHINADAPFEQLKRDIFRIAEKSPILVLKASTNKLAKIKVQCLEAEKFRIIAFDEGEEGKGRHWVFIDKEPLPFCNMNVGEHKVDGLVKFFLEDKEGKDWYTKVTNALKQALSPKR